jgi:hypothetical protein
MENIKAELAALQAAQRSTEHGWTWFYDASSGVICAQKGKVVRKVFIPHPESADEQGSPTLHTHNDAYLIAQVLNDMPKVLNALERAVSFAEGLEEMAGMRERAAQSARRDERYDLSEVHRQSAKRVRTTKDAFIEEVSAAFANPEATADHSDNQ